jgi:hypothetical protein
MPINARAVKTRSESASGSLPEAEAVPRAKPLLNAHTHTACANAIQAEQNDRRSLKVCRLSFSVLDFAL